MANPHPTRSRFSGGKRLPSRKARSTRALLILLGTPATLATKPETLANTGLTPLSSPFM
jgi:hypothetical protein